VSNSRGPVMFAYDGSELSKLAIARAGELLAAGREALVACVWQPFDVGFVPVGGLHLDSTEVEQVRLAAERTAASGVELARAAGFSARSEILEASPIWKGLLDLADKHRAEAIVLGSHGRHGVAGAFFGSVASAVASHTRRTVLIVHRDGE
jgi:nucleotide-binding universal stress UspA family protein